MPIQVDIQMTGLVGTFALQGGVALRLARAGDADFLLRLFMEARPWLALAEGNRDFIHALYELQYRVMRTGQETGYPEHLDLLIEHLGDPVGRLVVNLGYSNWRIAELQIRSAAQGSGIGSTVMRRLQAAAARAGVPITLSTPVHGFETRQLYERLGFRVSSADDVMCQLVWHPPDRRAGGQGRLVLQA